MSSYKEILDEQRKFFDTNTTFSVEYRKEQLRKFRSLFVDNVDAICDAVYKDLRRPYDFGKMIEVDCCVEEIDYFIEHLDEWTKPEFKGDYPVGKAYVYKHPLGVVLVIGPFNAPFQLSLRPCVAAIAGGNTVILKPSEYSKHSSQLMEELISKYFDKKLITVINGDYTVARDLLKERYDKIMYTGGTQVGKIVMRAAAEHLTPVVLELGGKCPSYIDKDADIAKAVEKIATMKTLNCGQICVNTDYVLVHKDVKKEFTEALASFYKGLLNNNNAKETPLTGRIINENHWNRVNNLIQKTNGKLIYSTGESSDISDLFIPPHVYEINQDDILMQEEMFGPVLGLMEIDNIEDAIKLIRKGEKPLSAYIFTQNEEAAEKFVSEVMSGHSMVNDVVMHFTVLTIPFGGVGHSGMGRRNGKYDFESFTHEKAVVKKF